MNNQPTPETKSFYVTAFDVEEWAEKCIRLEKERDEAREKYATEATEHMLAINKICNERDDAREDLEHWKVEYEIVVSRLCGIKHERDNGIIAEHEIIPVLRKERDEAVEALNKILKNE